MNKIQTFKHKEGWTAIRIFAEDKISFSYATKGSGTGKTKEEAIGSLCDALMSLSEEMRKVVHECNINK